MAADTLTNPTRVATPAGRSSQPPVIPSILADSIAETEGRQIRPRAMLVSGRDKSSSSCHPQSECALHGQLDVCFMAGGVVGKGDERCVPSPSSTNDRPPRRQPPNAALG
eukprot:scaffold309887_cov33-Tisochrysis_lutea.AAC.2